MKSRKRIWLGYILLQVLKLNYNDHLTKVNLNTFIRSANCYVDVFKVI